MEKNRNITQKELKETLHYNPDTGIFTWIKRNSNRIKIGDTAGSVKHRGYIFISIQNKVFLAHTLAFLYMDGYIPENDIDHIDRNPSNNKWINLRHVSRSCNMRNASIRKDNKSGIVGVSWFEKRKKWVSIIQVNHKTINLGQYKSFTKAVYHRWKAEIKYDFPNCNSTSTAYLYLKNKGLI